MLKPIHEKHLPWAFRIAAFPRPAPEPWFLFFMLFNMGAFFSMSGKIKKRILLPRMYTCSSCATRPSLYVTVMLDIWKGITTSSSVRAKRVNGEQGHRKGLGCWEGSPEMQKLMSGNKRATRQSQRNASTYYGRQGLCQALYIYGPHCTP